MSGMLPGIFPQAHVLDYVQTWLSENVTRLADDRVRFSRLSSASKMAMRDLRPLERWPYDTFTFYPLVQARLFSITRVWFGDRHVRACPTHEKMPRYENIRFTNPSKSVTHSWRRQKQ